MSVATSSGLELRWLPGRFGVFRFAPGSQLAPWTREGAFVTVSASEDELSVLCAWPAQAPAAPSIGPLRAARVVGSLDFSSTGIIAALSAPLARAGISLFSVATYDTDYLLVGEQDAERATAALVGAGFTFADPC